MNNGKNVISNTFVGTVFGAWTGAKNLVPGNLEP
jgi:hypothetical protein